MSNLIYIYLERRSQNNSTNPDTEFVPALSSLSAQLCPDQALLDNENF
ncbi:hypothetical protein [Coleofasciculus sp.]